MTQTMYTHVNKCKKNKKKRVEMNRSSDFWVTAKVKSTLFIGGGF
jgi:hypothetical protein